MEKFYKKKKVTTVEDKGQGAITFQTFIKLR